MAEPAWDWGDVPDDPDVRAASRLLGLAGEGAPVKKRHHYVSQTYLDGFCGSDGKLWTYYLDKPHAPQPSRPEAVAYSNYYYSQTRDDGTRDDNALEDLWSAFETVWPETLKAIRAGRVSLASSFNVLGMVCVHAVRVPAARHRHELLLATKLRAEAMALERRGTLPDVYQRYAGQLDTVPVAANPQRSIATMKEDMLRFGDLCFQIGFEVVHNDTDLSFITSDNPVCVYDPRRLPVIGRPYEYDGQVELICPLDANTLLRGNSRIRPVNRISRHVRIKGRGEIARLNSTLSRFAYGLAMAPDRSSDKVIAMHAARCPTISFKVVETDAGGDIIWRHVFGPRPKLATYIDTPEKAARLEADLRAAARPGFGEQGE